MSHCLTTQDADHLRKQRKREYMKVYLKGYYQRNKEKAALNWKARYHAKKESIKRYVSQWRKDNPDKVKAIRRRQASKSNTRRKAWAKKNPEHLKAYLRDYKLRNAASILHQNQIRRALKAKATVNLASLKRFVKEVKGREFSVCYYCASEIPSNVIHFDHIIPLSKGGSHSVDNLCVSCALCNLSKADKMLGVWMPIGQQLLVL